MKNKTLALLLLFIPTFFLWIGLQFDRTKYGTDPESAYLMNGLNIATLHSVGHYDNPGTTVQIYSAALIRVTHLLRNSGDDIETDVLKHPEYYIEMLRHSIIILNAMLLLAAGLATFLLLQNIWAALILQVAPFVSATLIEEMFTKVAPEPFLFFATFILAIGMFAYCRKKEPALAKFAIFFGILTGFGIATKLTFLPMAVIPLLLLRDRKNILKYIIITAIAFIFFTLPAVKGYPHMAAWFFNLGTHSGTYGQGSNTIIDPSAYMHSLAAITKNNAALIITMVPATVLVLVLFRKKIHELPVKSSVEFRSILAILLAQILGILMVAKHYHSNHYLFPALSLVGAACIFFGLLIGKTLEEKSHQAAKIFWPLLLLAIVTMSFTNRKYLTEAQLGYRLSNNSTDSTMQLLDNQYKDFAKVYYYPTSFNLYSSLRWGNVYARQQHTPVLEKLYPEGLFFDIRNGSFQRWETNISPSDFIAGYGGKILLVGGPLTAEGLQEIGTKGLALKKLYDARLHVIFEIDTAESEIFKREKAKSNPVWSLKCDFDTLSADKQWIVSGNKPVCKNEALAKGTSRSGSNAISMEGVDSYALNYVLKNVQPGQKYLVTIWRKASTESSSLVVTASNTNLLYIATEKGTLSDAKGWQKLSVDFEIPSDFKENETKIYLWNHDANSAVFDDFSVIRYK